MSVLESYDYIKLKDCKIEELDIAESDMWVASFCDNYHMKINTYTKELLECFNGKNSLLDIVDFIGYEDKAKTEVELKNFIDEILVNNSLIEGLNRPKKRRITFNLRFPLIQGKSIYFLLERLKFLYNKKLVVLLVTISFFIQSYVFLIGSYQLYMSYKESKSNSLVIIGFFFLGTIIHEIGHATAARYYHVDVGKMGLGLYLLMPVAYTDLSCIWAINRKQRIVVNLGGFYFSLIYSAVLSVIGIAASYNSLLITSVIIIITMFMNANPLLRMDGYWILCDAFGIVNLNKTMYELIHYLFKKIAHKDANFPINSETHHRKVYYIYLICFAMCNMITLTFSVLAILAII